MADADEDAIPRSQPSPNSTTDHNDPSYDPEDETQDFRFLASLSPVTGALPKRGEKDFEPNPTRSQASALNASREAMHNALAVERIHPPRNSLLVGQYLPDERDWRQDAPTAIYGPGARCVVVEKFKGGHNKTLGREDWRNWTWLLPEEALFLLERGTLDIRWPDKGVEAFGFDAVKGESSGGVAIVGGGEGEESEPEKEETSGELHGDLNEGYGSTENLLDGEIEDIQNNQDEGDGDKKVNGRITGTKPVHHSLQVGELPMSLQGAYASLVGKSGLSLERYTVYASLKRLGYVVHRAPTWDTDVYQPNSNATAAVSTDPASSTALSRPTISTTAATRVINRITSWLFTPQSRQYNPSHGPLIGPGLYRNYSDIFRTLALVPIHTTTTTADDTNTSSLSQPTQPSPPFQIHFNVFRPSTAFKKTDPPQPDFRICVLNARTTSIPTLEQITTLLDSLPPDTLPKDKKMEQRLKHGMRNVTLGIVDCGLVSYLRLADCGFAEHGKVYEEKARRGGKRGGGYRGRGRGRGRGGRGGAGGGTRGS